MSWTADLGLERVPHRKFSRRAIPHDEFDSQQSGSFVCCSRSGVWRREHDLDRDQKCIFCDAHVTWSREEGLHEEKVD